MCFLTILLASVSCVFGLQDMNFNGEYIVFRPSTKSIKLDLVDEHDVVLLEQIADNYTKSSPLYRVNLLLEKLDLSCTIFKQEKPMVSGHYTLWNESEKKDVEINWKSVGNIIQVFTNIDGDRHNVFSWKDRSKNISRKVNYVGFLVTRKNQSDHIRWKLREEDANDFDIQKSYKLCSLEFLPKLLDQKTSPIYQILITREEDETFAISVQKASVEVARIKTNQMDPYEIVALWDKVGRVISLGLKNDTAPLLLWQDRQITGNDAEQVKFLRIQIKKDKVKKTFDITNSKSVEEAYPKYFSSSPTFSTTTPGSTIVQTTDTRTVSVNITTPAEDDSKYELISKEDLII